MRLNKKTNIMKKSILSIVIAFIVSMTTSAQSPQAFKYQTVVRDAAGDILQNQSVSLRFKIHDNTAGGTVVYSEAHYVTTNQFGLANLNIGTGTVLSGTFANIAWGTNPKFLEVELDPNGGSSYTSMGTTQLLSVPYALYAESTGNTDDADADPTNEHNISLGMTGNTIEIEDGGGTLTT
ncbi:MAG: collagen-like protein, partial [Bacteroidetes bacterium]